MKFSSEAKVGLIGIVTLAVLIWGINYLKGRNILSNSYSLHAFFEHAGGLETSAPVMMRGMKIGYVDEISMLTAKGSAIQMILSIDKKYPVNRGSVGELFSANLLGTKAIRILPSGTGGVFTDGDTINTSVAPDMLTSLQDQVQPVMEQIHSLAGTLDTLAKNLDALLDSGSADKTLQHLASVSGSLKQSLDKGGALHKSFSNLEAFTTMLELQQEEIASLIQHLNSIGQSLDDADLGQVAESLDAVSHQFEMLLDQINSGEGNMGKLFYSDSLYHNLDNLIADLDTLIRDLHENPQDYVQISVFGRQNKNK